MSGCEPKPVSAGKIHSSHGAQSPRAHETASSNVCGTWIDMATGIVSFVVVESLCNATVTLFERLDSKTPCSMYTLANDYGHHTKIYEGFTLL